MMAKKRQVTLVFLLLSVIISFAVLVSFYLGMMVYIRNESYTAIQSSKSYYQDSDVFDDMEAERLYGIAIELSDDYRLLKVDEEVEELYYGGFSKKSLQALASWTQKNASQGEIGLYQKSGRYFYATAEKLKGQLVLIFVEVTPEMDLVRSMSVILLLVLLTGLVGAGISGLYFGGQLERDRQKEKEFFENASHELKTPLMVIQGYADGLEEGIVSQEQASRAILQETDKMRRLVDEIMHLSRLDSGALPLQKTRISLEELLDNCLYPISFQARRQGLMLRTQIEDRTVLADPQQLERALTNILANSLRYAETYIELKAEKNRISIANDGQQLDDQALRHIFDRFYTGPNGNTGIGLALTQKIITEHGWKLRAENTADGVAFVIQTL